VTHAVPAPASKPYVVHKGDTLVKITKEVYGKSTPEVISFVVDANKGDDQETGTAARKARPS
jgi:nucleoid-associated protein YgaU